MEHAKTREQAENREKIGNVVLDLSSYPGEDYYCDGEVEDELLEIVKKQEPDEFQKVIEEKANWPVLYHLSSLRGNIMEWFPIKPGSKVLEIGSGCGAITGILSDKAASVTCIDLSKKRSLINAYRNRKKENICIKVGNFQDIEPKLDTDFDIICLIGVYEYARGYIGGGNPYEEFLKRIAKHCKAQGQIVIAIENRLGMKYFAGCREDHLGDFGSGIEDYPAGGVVRTFSRPALEKIFERTGIRDYHFYYPYPDYKFPTTIYSDDRLPAAGELTNNLRNFDRSRLTMFDEKNAFDSVIRDGVFPLFSNSYLVVIGPKPETIYSKFSNDRAPEYAVRTDIYKDDGITKVRKTAVLPQAKQHLKQMLWAARQLAKRYEGSRLEICPCVSIQEDEIAFPYLPGITLEEILDDCLDQKDSTRFMEYLRQFCEAVSAGRDKKVSDYDLIFSNILINEKKQWQLIDYEWTMEKEIPPEQIIKRALYCYRLGSEKRRNLSMEEICKNLNLGTWDEEKIARDELEFQKQVTGQRYSMSQMWERIHNEVLSVEALITREEQRQAQNRVQVYYDSGQGFSEENSLFLRPVSKAEYENGNKNDYKNNMGNRSLSQAGSDYVVRIPVRKGTKCLRFDPAMQSCLVCFERIVIAGPDGKKDIMPSKLSGNGVCFGKNTYVFAGTDPNVMFPPAGLESAEFVEVYFTLTELTDQAAENMCRGSRKSGKTRVKSMVGRLLRK